MQLISEKGWPYIVSKKDVDRRNKHKGTLAIALPPTTNTTNTTTTSTAIPAINATTITTATPTTPTFPPWHGMSVGHIGYTTNPSAYASNSSSSNSSNSSSNSSSMSPQRPSNVYTRRPEGRHAHFFTYFSLSSIFSSSFLVSYVISILFLYYPLVLISFSPFVFFVHLVSFFQTPKGSALRIPNGAALIKPITP